MQAQADPIQTSIWNTDEIAAASERVDALLGARGLSAVSELPPLDIPGINADEVSWVEQLIRWLLSFLPFGRVKGGGIDPAVIYWVSVAIIAISLIAIAVILVLGILRLRHGRRTTGILPFRRDGTLPADAESRLLMAIETAKQAGAWAKAGRLRWRLFLLRKSLSAGTTPAEVPNQPTHDHYEFMFRDPHPKQDAFLASEKLMIRDEHVDHGAKPS